MHELVQIAYSPWSERARWALDHHGIAYRRLPYLPGISEAGLRWRLGRLRGRVTVPVLFPDDGPPITDSLDIARWAEARGQGSPLFRPADEASQLAWHALADRMLEAGRILSTHRTLADHAAMDEMLPGWLKAVGPLGHAVGRQSARNLLRKYDPAHVTPEACVAVLDDGMRRLAEALGKGRYLDGAFGWSDLTMAVGLSFVKPAASHRGLGPAGRRVWTVDEVADRWPDMLAWRDALLADHRGGPVGARAAQVP